MNEGKRTVKDHGQPEVGDWRITGGTGILMRVAGVAVFPDDTEWLPASAVVIPDHYAPVPRPPAKFKRGDWVTHRNRPDLGAVQVTDVLWWTKFGVWAYDFVGRDPDSTLILNERLLTKVDPPFPSSLSAVGWRPLAELEDGSDVAVWVLFKGGLVGKSRGMRREYDDDLGRVAWAPVIGAPPVPSDWSPA